LIFKNNFNKEILQKTVPLLKEYRCTPDEIIFEENIENENAVYFIENGSIDIILSST
jgi:hypothetical protein